MFRKAGYKIPKLRDGVKMPEIWGALGLHGVWVSASSEELALGMAEFPSVKKRYVLSLINLRREV